MTEDEKGYSELEAEQELEAKEMARDRDLNQRGKKDCQNNKLRGLLQEFNNDPHDFETQLDINEWFDDIADCMMN